MVKLERLSLLNRTCRSPAFARLPPMSATSAWHTEFIPDMKIRYLLVALALVFSTTLGFAKGKMETLADLQAAVAAAKGDYKAVADIVAAACADPANAGMADEIASAAAIAAPTLAGVITKAAVTAAPNQAAAIVASVVTTVPTAAVQIAAAAVQAGAPAALVLTTAERAVGATHDKGLGQVMLNQLNDNANSLSRVSIEVPANTIAVVSTPVNSNVTTISTGSESIGSVAQSVTTTFDASTKSVSAGK